jgi:UPF0271 protein
MTARCAVRLNIDLGELEGEPEELYEAAHIANIACGGHAGDDRSMSEAVERCLRHGTDLGAHPSYPDREGFGRREIAIDAQSLEDAVAAQCARLARLARPRGASVRYVKAHGSLYHAADRDPVTAEAVIRGALRGLGASPPDITLIGPPGGALIRASERAGLRFAREAFADRTMRPDGTLVPRSEAGAVVTDSRVVGARTGEICARADVDTICVHGDSPGAIALARAARAALERAWVP